MSIDFHAVAIKHDLYEKYESSPKLESLYWLHHIMEEGENDRGLLHQLADDYIDTYCFDESNREDTRSHFHALIDAKEFPTCAIELGREWEALERIFTERESAALENCFFGGDPSPFDSNEYSVLHGQELSVVARALREQKTDDEFLRFALSDLTEFYRLADDKNMYVIRGLY